MQLPAFINRSLHTRLWWALAPALLLVGAGAVVLHKVFASALLTAAACIAAACVAVAWVLAHVARLCITPALKQVQAQVQAAASQQTATKAGLPLADLALPPMQELQPLVLALNTLLAQQRDAMQQHQRFLADASHQLRTPLAVLRTQLQGKAETADQAQMLRTLDRATAVADELLSRLKIQEQLRQALPWLPLDLHAVACEAALEFSPLIAEKRLHFSLDVVADHGTSNATTEGQIPPTITVPAEAWMLGELVRNLLANALRHTPHGQPMGVVVRRVAGQPELIVWDSGHGMASATRERLFEPFAAATGGSGVGLGLSICRQLAQALGAEVQLYNRTDGHQVVGVDAVVRWSAAGSLAKTETPAQTLSAAALPAHVSPVGTFAL